MRTAAVPGRRERPQRPAAWSASREAGGYGLDAVWADEWHHALHAVLTGERAGYYEDFGSLDPVWPRPSRQAWVHDGDVVGAPRPPPRPPAPTDLPGDRFVVATQNHDQVGNRATGDRLAALTGLSDACASPPRCS